MELKKLYEQRARVWKQMEDRTKDWEAITERGEEIPKDQEAEYDKWDAEFDDLTKKIDRQKKFEERESANVDHEERKEEPKKEVDHKEEYRKAFMEYLKGGLKRMSPESIDILSGKYVNHEGRAANPSQTSPDAQGGYTIPEGFSYEVEVFMKYHGPFGETGNGAPYRDWQSATGNDLPWPTNDDTANAGYLLAESGDATTSSVGITFGQEILKAYAYVSGLIPVTRQLIQDNEVNFISLLAELLGTRLGRAKNAACTTGTGSSQPEGVVTGATQGKVSASSTAFTTQELLDTLYSVDRAYRQPGNKVGWMMHPNIVGEIRKLDLSTTNYTQPLYVPSAQDGQPDKILGHQYWENGDMASTLATGNKIALFGDFNKFVIRRVKDMELLVSEDRYFEFLQIAYLGWMRFDSRVMNADAIKYLELT